MATTSVDELEELSIRETLDADSRPTFVIDLDPDEEAPAGVKLISPVFCNAALRSHEQLFDGIIGPAATGLDQDISAYEKFKRWATGITTHDASKDVFPQSVFYGDLLWSGSTVRQRWRLVSGNLLWRAEDFPPGDLSSGIPPEVSTGGVRAEQAEISRKRKSIVTPENAPGEPAAVAAAPVAPGPDNDQPLPNPAQQPDVGSITDTGTMVSSKQNQPGRPFFYQSTPTGSSDETKGSSQSVASISLHRPPKAVADWTVKDPKGVLSEHVKLARSIDWATTPLGPMDKWSAEFRQLANLCMNNPHPVALLWGSDLTMLYNEAYAAEVAGKKHPSLMGTGFSGPFSELWDYAGPVFAECARTGISVRKEDDYLPIDRHNLLEETFYSWTWTPLYGGTNRIVGFYNAPFETTDAVISHRRMTTINRLGELTSQARTVKQYWKAVLEGLEDNHRDVPFALLYSVGDTEDPDQSSVSSGSTISLKTCYLEGTIGVPEGHVAAPQHLDLKRSREGFVPSFREAMRTREPTLLHTRDGTLPEALLEGINWRGFGEPCRDAIIFPGRPTNGDAVLAFLVLGVNPRRPFDEKYQAFTSMLHRQLATSLASVILFEDEIRRSRDAAEAAALEKEHLTQQLALQDSRLRRMTELSPLGMFLISPEGVLREANDRFYEMTGLTRDSQYEMSWTDIALGSSSQTLEEGWQCLVEKRLPWSGELQLKHRSGNLYGNLPGDQSTNPVNLHGESIDYWVMFIAHPEFTSEGQLRSVMGSIMDISHLKWVHGLQNRRIMEAEETRRQQNEFIDITSHEMRNPLSAILQCADDIFTVLSDFRAKGQPPPQDVVESCVEAANTIALCVQHQKSIVDDILTVSKLDSNLLLITPSTAQPKVVLDRALKMFEPELQVKGIEVSYEKRPSYDELAVDWVTIDPSRVLQILINLMTNAIKFTAPASKRLISVAVGASLTPPDSSHIPGFEYAPAGKASSTQVTTAGDWGTGQLLYILFEVQDTGCGLTHEEKQILFQRFKQASPRTHAQYGGSGLGLFISKHLTELHGGQIGVASEAGLGSRFALYVQARRAGPPSQATQVESQGVMPIERQLGDDAQLTTLSQSVTPQRQDYATSGHGAGLVAIKASQPYDATTTHILVVEDNLINQRVLAGQLKKAGCKVNVANDGVEALEFLAKTKFCVPDGAELSVILMDLEMPNMDGLTCVRRIRQMEQEGKTMGHIPVIAVTANVRDEQVETARRAGMDDVVSKPFRIPDLLKKIEVLLKGT